MYLNIEKRNNMNHICKQIYNPCWNYNYISWEQEKNQNLNLHIKYIILIFYKIFYINQP